MRATPKHRAFGLTMGLLLLAATSWSASLRAQDVIGIRIGMPDAEVRKILGAEGYKITKEDKESGFLTALTNGKDYTTSLKAEKPTNTGGIANDMVQVWFATPPTQAVVEIRRDVRFIENQQPGYEATWEAMNKKYAPPEHANGSGRSPEHVTRFFDKAGKSIWTPEGATQCARESGAYPWIFREVVAGRGAISIVNCGRFARITVKANIRNQELASIFGVSLLDGALMERAAEKSRDALVEIQENQRKSAIENSKGVSIPKL